jgi:hypothetical protein
MAQWLQKRLIAHRLNLKGNIMKTDLSSIKNGFVPDYNGWENDFDELCRRLNKITVKLQSRDLPAGVEQQIQQRAAKNGFAPTPNHAGNRPEILIFTKSASQSPPSQT